MVTKNRNDVLSLPPYRVSGVREELSQVRCRRMNAPETIETERLLLRRVTLDDADAIHAYASNPAVMKYLSRPPSTDPSQSEAFVERCARVWESGEAYAWAITEPPAGELMGMIEARPSRHGIELGYVLSQAAWGKEYMVEAAKAVSNWAWSHPDVHRVWATTNVGNVGSQRVLEKLEMTREGILHRWDLHPNVSSVPSDAYVYAKWQ